MIQNTNYQGNYKDFNTFINVVGYKQASQYTKPVQEFLAYLELIGVSSIKKVTPSILINYHEHLSQRPKQRAEGVLSPRTINGHLFGLRLFFDMLLEQGAIQNSFLLPSFIRGEKQERDSLTQDEIKILYSVAESKLERAILSVCYGCGLRRVELKRLDTSAVQFNKGNLIVVKGKFNKRRDVPMSEGVIRDLKDYFIHERPDYLKDKKQHEPAFFVNQKGKRMLGDTLNEVVKEICLRTGHPAILQKSITLHSLRHSLAEHLIQRGASLEFVRLMLGHAEIDTTAIYAIKQRNQKILSL